MEQEKYHVNPENIMPEEDMPSYLDAQNGNIKPIISLEPDKTMPLFIYGITGNFEGETMDFMASIIHLIPTNEIEIRGRLRNQMNGNKTKFLEAHTEKYTVPNLNLLKGYIAQTTQNLIDKLGVQPYNPHWEVEFDPKESLDSIIQKMNDSNQFNIGIAKKD